MSWNDSENESAMSPRALDAHYGEGHRPQPRKTGDKWATGCTCSPDCERATSPGWSPDWETAHAASAHHLTLAENGPAE